MEPKASVGGDELKETGAPGSIKSGQEKMRDRRGQALMNIVTISL
jgi:hypothetical protein